MINYPSIAMDDICTINDPKGDQFWCILESSAKDGLLTYIAKEEKTFGNQRYRFIEKFFRSLNITRIHTGYGCIESNKKDTQ